MFFIAVVSDGQGSTEPRKIKKKRRRKLSKNDPAGNTSSDGWDSEDLVTQMENNVTVHTRETERGTCKDNTQIDIAENSLNIGTQQPTLNQSRLTNDCSEEQIQDKANETRDNLQSYSSSTENNEVKENAHSDNSTLSDNETIKEQNSQTVVLQQQLENSLSCNNFEDQNISTNLNTLNVNDCLNDDEKIVNNDETVNEEVREIAGNPKLEPSSTEENENQDITLAEEHINVNASKDKQTKEYHTLNFNAEEFVPRSYQIMEPPMIIDPNFQYIPLASSYVPVQMLTPYPINSYNPNFVQPGISIVVQNPKIMPNMFLPHNNFVGKPPEQYHNIQELKPNEFQQKQEIFGVNLTNVTERQEAQLDNVEQLCDNEKSSNEDTHANSETINVKESNTNISHKNHPIDIARIVSKLEEAAKQQTVHESKQTKMSPNKFRNKTNPYQNEFRKSNQYKLNTRNRYYKDRMRQQNDINPKKCGGKNHEVTTVPVNEKSMKDADEKLIDTHLQSKKEEETQTCPDLEFKHDSSKCKTIQNKPDLHEVHVEKTQIDVPDNSRTNLKYSRPLRNKFRRLNLYENNDQLYNGMTFKYNNYSDTVKKNLRSPIRKCSRYNKHMENISVKPENKDSRKQILINTVSGSPLRSPKTPNQWISVYRKKNRKNRNNLEDDVPEDISETLTYEEIQENKLGDLLDQPLLNIEIGEKIETQREHNENVETLKQLNTPSSQPTNIYDEEQKDTGVEERLIKELAQETTTSDVCKTIEKKREATVDHKVKSMPATKDDAKRKNKRETHKLAMKRIIIVDANLPKNNEVKNESQNVNATKKVVMKSKLTSVGKVENAQISKEICSENNNTSLQANSNENDIKHEYVQQTQTNVHVKEHIPKSIVSPIRNDNEIKQDNVSTLEKKKNKKKKKQMLNQEKEHLWDTNNANDSYNLSLNTSTPEENEKTYVEVSQELDKMIQKGLYNSLEEKIKSFNATVQTDSFFKSISFTSVLKPSTPEKNFLKVDNFSSLLYGIKKSKDISIEDKIENDMPRVSLSKYESQPSTSKKEIHSKSVQKMNTSIETHKEFKHSPCKSNGKLKNKSKKHLNTSDRETNLNERGSDKNETLKNQTENNKIKDEKENIKTDEDPDKKSKIENKSEEIKIVDVKRDTDEIKSKLNETNCKIEFEPTPTNQTETVDISIWNKENVLQVHYSTEASDEIKCVDTNNSQEDIKYCYKNDDIVITKQISIYDNSQIRHETRLKCYNDIEAKTADTEPIKMLLEESKFSNDNNAKFEINSNIKINDIQCVTNVLKNEENIPNGVKIGNEIEGIYDDLVTEAETHTGDGTTADTDLQSDNIFETIVPYVETKSDDLNISPHEIVVDDNIHLEKKLIKEPTLSKQPIFLYTNDAHNDFDSIQSDTDVTAIDRIYEKANESDSLNELNDIKISEIKLNQVTAFLNNSKEDEIHVNSQQKDVEWEIIDDISAPILMENTVTKIIQKTSSDEKSSKIGNDDETLTCLLTAEDIVTNETNYQNDVKINYKQDVCNATGCNNKTQSIDVNIVNKRKSYVQCIQMSFEEELDVLQSPVPLPHSLSGEEKLQNCVERNEKNNVNSREECVSTEEVVKNSNSMPCNDNEKICDEQNKALYPITQAVRDWMTKTRENTPEIEILKSPHTIYKEFLKWDIESESDNENVTSNVGNSEPNNASGTTSNTSHPPHKEFLDWNADSEPDDDVETDSNDTGESKKRREKEITIFEHYNGFTTSEKENLISRDKSPGQNKTTPTAYTVQPDTCYSHPYNVNHPIEQGEDALEVYESKYGKNEDYLKIKEEVEEQSKTINNPKHGNLPYRAICCNLM